MGKGDPQVAILISLSLRHLAGSAHKLACGRKEKK
jgi:hypothetical protein